MARIVVLFFFIVLIKPSFAQTTDRDSIISIAKNIMMSSKTCALVTIDSSGFPQSRTMDPFPPESNMTIWLATNPRSNKVAEIMANPNVSLYYRDPDNTGYVSIVGKAILVDDQEMKQTYWKEEWALFYPDQDKSYLLIKVEPITLEIVCESKKILPVDNTWAPLAITFK